MNDTMHQMIALMLADGKTPEQIRALTGASLTEIAALKPSRPRLEPVTLELLAQHGYSIQRGALHCDSRFGRTEGRMTPIESTSRQAFFDLSLGAKRRRRVSASAIKKLSKDAGKTEVAVLKISQTRDNG